MTLALDVLEACGFADLDDLRYECEIECHDRLMESAKGSEARDGLFAEAHESLVAILAEHCKRHGLVMDSLGLAPGAADQLAGVLGSPPARLFDAGCGSGVLVEAMRGRGYEACGIDVSSRILAVGHARLACRSLMAIPDDAPDRGNFLHADQVDDGGFDLVLSNDVLKCLHPDEAPDFLRKADHLLRSGGVIWLVTPNLRTGPGDATALRHPSGTVARGLHLNEYTLTELVGMLRGTGFRRVRARLWSGGRLRSSSEARPCYALLKVAAEPALATLSPVWRRRIMNIMDYSLVAASKPPGDGSKRGEVGT